MIHREKVNDPLEEKNRELRKGAARSV